MTDIPTIQLEAKKDSIKQLQNGDGKLTLTVNAQDMNAAIASLWAAPMGTRYQVVMVEIGDDEQPVDRSAGAEAPKAKPPMTESQRCGMLCQKPDFQHWVRLMPTFDEWQDFANLPSTASQADVTAAFLRDYLNIGSRKELDDPMCPMLPRWEALLTHYEADTGRMAERR